MKTLHLIIITVLLLLVTACAPNTTTKLKAFPGMYEEKPTTLLVFPPMNQSTAAEAKEYYNTTIAEPLTLNGYYVLPLEIVSDILKSEGYSDTELLIDVPPQQFRDHFGADAVMFITIKGWDTSYYVVGGKVSVTICYVLKSTETAETLWSYENTLAVDTSGGDYSSAGLAGLVVSLVETAVKTAMTDYVPVAKKLNTVAVTRMPAGKYSPAYEKDGNQQIFVMQAPQEAQ